MEGKKGKERASQRSIRKRRKERKQLKGREMQVRDGRSDWLELLIGIQAVFLLPCGASQAVQMEKY